MGKRIIQQARGHGGPRYRVRRQAFVFRIKYPQITGKGKVIGLINSRAHTSPLAKIILNGEIFYNPACQGLFEGQEIEIGGNEIKEGNITALKNIPLGTRIYNIELRKGDGGKIIRTSGSSAIITKKEKEKVAVLLPSKQEKEFDENCFATIGIIAGQGRLDKPFMKAGKRYYLMKMRGGRVWPRTSAVKMNVVDHPFGSGRGKKLAHGGKGKTPKRNSPPGAKVGSISARRTGRRK